MNQKLIVANLMLAVLATACGDSTYAPNGMPNNQQGNTQFPIYQQFPNPQFPNQQFQNQSFPNQPFVNQNCNPVANNPFYYNQNFNQNYNQGCFQNQLMLNQQLQWSNQWMWQNQQPRVSMNCYGPSRNYIVSPNLQLYSPGRYVYVSRRGNTSCSTSIPVFTYKKVKTYQVQCISCSDDNNSVVTPSASSTSSTSSGNTGSNSTVSANPNSSTPAETTKTVNVVWSGDAAEALYNRLNVKEEDKPGRVSVKRGSHLTCFEDRSGKNTYTCVLNIDVLRAVVMKQESPAERITDKDRGFYKAAAYTKDDNLVIGGENQGLDEGVLNFDGPTAKEIFDHLKVEEKTIKVGINNKEAISKTSGQLQCYHTINTTNPTYYCSVKIQPSTGEVQEDFNVAPGSSEASDASQTGKAEQQQQTQAENQAGTTATGTTATGTTATGTTATGTTATGTTATGTTANGETPAQNTTNQDPATENQQQ
jgi:hypothetical protein